MKKILIIGNNSYLSTGLAFDTLKYKVDKVLRPFSSNANKYNDYDYIINFCIQPQHFHTLLSENEMIDVQIAKNITNQNTKFVFLSSRKVYGSSTKIKEFRENDELKPFDFYSKNKVNIEKKLNEILPGNLLILRTGNIIDVPSSKKNYSTFIGWLEAELIQHRKVIATVDKNSRKDFVTRDYFQEALKVLIENNLVGIYNVGSNFALTTEELLMKLLPMNSLEFNPQEKNSEQFILNCDKLNKYVRKFTKEELTQKCELIQNLLIEKIETINA